VAIPFSTGPNALRASEANCLRHITIRMPAVDNAKGTGPRNQPRVTGNDFAL
jgi:hypothetical protein